jgi:pimeloyl-ACP methyl ester carboxylesterase
VVLCLHGIGSGAASWLDVACELAPDCRLIAWDAPGYGRSTPLQEGRPRSIDYARRLHGLLDALELDRCVLVGHSLGALVATAAAQASMRGFERIARLVLISPARGYGSPDRADDSRRVRDERLSTLSQIGIAGMAAGRAGRLLSKDADELARQWVRWNMSRLNDAGYRQAVELLCGDDIGANLPVVPPVEVHCGAEDVITPPASCEAVARAVGQPLQRIASAGHASYVEQPSAVADRLRLALSATGFAWASEHSKT